MRSFSYSEDHLSAGKSTARGVLEEGMEEHTQSDKGDMIEPFVVRYLPSVLTQVPDVTSFFWVTLLSQVTKCDPQSNITRTIWRLVRNADSGASPQRY